MDGKEFTVSEVIDRAGISAHTWIVFVLLAFAMIFDGYDFMIVNSTNTYVAPTFFALRLLLSAHRGSDRLSDYLGPARHGSWWCRRRYPLRHDRP